MIKVTEVHQLDGTQEVVNIDKPIEDVIDDLQSKGYEFDHWTGWWVKGDEMILLEEI